MPHGPTRFGPMRFCMRPTTLRSNTIENSVITTRNANTPTTLIRTSQIGWSPNPGRFWPPAQRSCADQALSSGSTSDDRRGIGAVS